MVRTLLAVTAAALLRSGAEPAPADLAGTYRLEGRGRVEAHPFPAREAELHADVIVTEREEGGIHLHVAGQGLTCELDATLDAAGAVTIARGQRCATPLDGDAFEGRVEARLVSGTGRLRGDQLELDLAFTVSGEVRMKGGGLLGNIGRRLQLPGTGADAVPLSGEGQARGRGWRDRSRAAAR